MKVLVLDIETTGLSKTNDIISVIGTIVYESLNNTTISKKCYNVMVAEDSTDKNEIIAMKKDIINLLDDADCVVAFNGINFDMPFIVKWLHDFTKQHNVSDPLGKRKTPEYSTDTVVQTGSNARGSTDNDRWKHKYLDFCRLSKDYTGSYISLNNACLENKIKIAKNGSGLQAIQWAKDKKWDLLESYCMQDVVVLLALTQHATTSGLILPLTGYGKRKAKKENTMVLYFDAVMQPFVHEDDTNHNDIFDTASPNVLDFHASVDKK